MKTSTICFYTVVFLSLSLSARAQDTTRIERVVLFEGRTIENVELSGGFEVEIRQGTPNGVVLEVPQGIQVDTVYSPKPIQFSKEWLYQMYDRRNEIRDTIRCRLEHGTLQLRNLRPKVTGPGKGSVNLTWESGPKSKAVITVGDLRGLKVVTKDAVHFVGKMRTTETKLRVGPVDGLDITASKKVVVSTVVGGRQEIKVSGTPQVVVKANVEGKLDLTVDSVGYLEVGSYVEGAEVNIRGAVDTLASRVYYGKVEVGDLQVGTIIQPEEKVREKGDLTEWLKKEGYIIEKNGNSTVIRKAK